MTGYKKSVFLVFILIVAGFLVYSKGELWQTGKEVRKKVPKLGVDEKRVFEEAAQESQTALD